MENSKIEWTENTFNPWIGCAKISPACDHCYAADLSARTFKVKWGAGEARKRTGESYWKQPIKWNAEAAKSGTRPRIFCASLSDVFDNEVPVQWRADLFDLIRLTPNLSWMILTKRIGNWHTLVTKAHQCVMNRLGGKNFNDFKHEDFPIWDLGMWLQKWLSGNAPENVHLGATICNQTEADRDISKLLAASAAKRFLSIEPMLGPIDLTEVANGKTEEMRGYTRLSRHNALRNMRLWGGDGRGIDLVIAGGESGPHARPSHPDWFRSLRDQCTAAGVQFMFKQWGEWCPQSVASTTDAAKSAVYLDCDGASRPADFGTRKDSVTMQKVGKKAAGRVLDGVEHNGRIVL